MIGEEPLSRDLAANRQGHKQQMACRTRSHLRIVAVLKRVVIFYRLPGGTLRFKAVFEVRALPLSAAAPAHIWSCVGAAARARQFGQGTGVVMLD
eukprot:356419-Prymnesium_polylepis.2